MDKELVNEQMAFLKGKNCFFQEEDKEAYKGDYVSEFMAGWLEAEEEEWERKDEENRKKLWQEKHSDDDRWENRHANAEYEAINCATGEIKPAIEE